MPTIKIPYNFEPRSYQRDLFEARDKGVGRFLTVWHRRAGKDKTWLNFCVREMMQRVGVYYYFFPTYSQGKKILWDGMDASGYRFLNHIPTELRDGPPHGTEMKIRLVNGSLFQIVGSDNIDSIVGTNPVGCIFSEYALQDPSGWEFVSPILRENGGWAGFNFTPRGKNHAWTLYRMAQNNPEWFCQLLTVEDTGVLKESDIEAERRAGVDEEIIQQEYFCSFESGMQGSYFGNQLRQAYEDGRIGSVPHDPMLPVETWWDLGVGDSTAIWFTQTLRNEVRFIDYYETSGEGLPYYRRFLETKPYNYSAHYAPHDIKVKELGTGRTRLEIARSLGINFRVLPKLDVEDGIEAARAIFGRCWFDEKNCRPGLDALASYHKEWDAKRSEFKNHPLHDWSSHAADAFRGFAIGHRDAQLPTKRDRYAVKPKQTLSWKTA